MTRWKKELPESVRGSCKTNLELRDLIKSRNVRDLRTLSAMALDMAKRERLEVYHKWSVPPPGLEGKAVLMLNRNERDYNHHIGMFHAFIGYARNCHPYPLPG